MADWPCEGGSGNHCLQLSEGLRTSRRSQIKHGAQMDEPTPASQLYGVEVCLGPKQLTCPGTRMSCQGRLTLLSLVLQDYLHTV